MHMHILVVNITGERDSQCKDPEVGTFLDSLRKHNAGHCFVSVDY